MRFKNFTGCNIGQFFKDEYHLNYYDAEWNLIATVGVGEEDVTSSFFYDCDEEDLHTTLYRVMFKFKKYLELEMNIASDSMKTPRYLELIALTTKNEVGSGAYIELNVGKHKREFEIKNKKKWNQLKDQLNGAYDLLVMGEKEDQIDKVSLQSAHSKLVTKYEEELETLKNQYVNDILYDDINWTQQSIIYQNDFIVTLPDLVFLCGLKEENTGSEVC